MWKISNFPILFMAVIFSGCAALASLGGGSTSTGASDVTAVASAPGPSLFNFVGTSTKFEFVSPSALLADSSRIQATLIHEQCRFHNADPPFLVPALDQKWLFAGRMNQGPTIEALEYKSILTLGLTGPQQLNPWPVKMISLSDFADDYLLERVNAMGKARPDIRNDILVEYINNSRQIRAITDDLIQKYNPQVECLHAG